MNFIRQNIIGALTISSLVVFSIFISQFLSSKDILISSAFMCIFLGLILGNIYSFKKIEPFANFCLKKVLGLHYRGTDKNKVNWVTHISKEEFIKILENKIYSELNLLC